MIQKEETTSDNNSPVHQVRLRSISATIFNNEASNGDSFQTAKIQRSYRDGDQWKNTNSYSFDDLLVLQEVLELTIGWMRRQIQLEFDAPRKSRRGQPTTDLK